jgi:hypothetical protein
VGANSLAPSTLSTLTTTNICDINDTVIDDKQDLVGKKTIFTNLLSVGD